MQFETELFCCGPSRSLDIKSFTANEVVSICIFFWNLGGTHHRGSHYALGRSSRCLARERSGSHAGPQGTRTYTHKDGTAMCPAVHHIPRDRSKCVPVTAGFPRFSPTVFTQRSSAGCCLTLSWTPRLANCWANASECMPQGFTFWCRSRRWKNLRDRRRKGNKMGRRKKERKEWRKGSAMSKITSTVLHAQAYPK